MNDDTGRAIKVNGPTYHKLLAKGYEVSFTPALSFAGNRLTLSGHHTK